MRLGVPGVSSSLCSGVSSKTLLLDALELRLGVSTIFSSPFPGISSSSLLLETLEVRLGVSSSFSCPFPGMPSSSILLEALEVRLGVVGVFSSPSCGCSTSAESCFPRFGVLSSGVSWTRGDSKWARLIVFLPFILAVRASRREAHWRKTNLLWSSLLWGLLWGGRRLGLKYV